MRPILLFFVLLCLASCAHKPKPSPLEAADGALTELRTAVAHEVKDPARAKQALGLVDELDRGTTQAAAELKAHDAKIRALNADYDATPDAFRAAFRDFNAVHDAHEKQVFDINRRAKALLSAEEWRALGKVREEALERIIQAGRES